MRGVQAVILLLISVLLRRPGVVGLVAYDCADENVNITTISLRKVADCPEPNAAYKSEPVRAKVLQRSDIGLTHVWTCLVEVTRLITYCGMHSHSSVVAGGLLSYIHKVGPEECKLIHRYHTFKFNEQSIGRIASNATTTASLTLHGRVDSSGSCDGTDYQENGMSWHNVIVVANVKIQIMDYYASVRLKENEVSLKGGIICVFLEAYCFDSTLGESTWNYEASTCESQFSLLFDGQGEKVTNVLTEEQYIVVDKEPKIFAVTLLKKIQLCGSELWQTEHPQLLVLEGEGQVFHPSTVILTQNTDMILYVNSKFLYVEQSYKRNLHTLYIDVVHRRCLMHREILKNRLLLAPVVPDAVSQIIQEKEGYIGHVLGEVLYILKCIPKQVRIRRTDTCYQELPIEVNNQSKFMSPITRIIQNHAEEIDCNGLTPPLYYLDGEWIGLVPQPTVRRPPKELTPSAQSNVKFQPIQPLGSRGLYTQEEISKVQKLLTFGTERKAVENILARRIIGMETSDQGFSTLGIFNPEEVRQLAHTTMKQIWGWFTDLGMFMSGMIGFYVIFRIIKYIIGVVINGLHIYQTVGRGFALLACFWNTLTMWVVHKHSREQKKDSDPEQLRERGPESRPSASFEEDASASKVTAPPSKVYPTVPARHWTETEN